VLRPGGSRDLPSPPSRKTTWLACQAGCLSPPVYHAESPVYHAESVQGHSPPMTVGDRACREKMTWSCERTCLLSPQSALG